MASNTETATSKVILDGQQAEDEMKRLSTLALDLRKKLRLAVQAGDDAGAKKLKKELAGVEKEAAAAKREMNSISNVMKNLNGSSLKQLSQAQRQLAAEIRNSTRNTKEEVEAIKVKQKQLRMLKAEMDKVQSGMAFQSGGALGKMANGFNKYFTMASSMVLAVTGVAMSFKQLISGNSELSDSFSDVAKTTGLTIKEVKSLYKELGKIDTRTPRKELLDLAYIAGKLGYTGEAEILGFVKAANQIGVALSKDLGGNVEDAVTSLGKLTDIFKIKDKFGIEEALLKTGSAINALGASGTASEAYLVDFTNRLGGIAPQAGISIDKIMGLGATLDQLGQQVETSSTAVTQLITKMFQKPGEYAKIAGMDVAAFTKLIKTDANAALIKLLEGLNKNKGGLTELAGKFGDLGVDGSRAIGVIGALANNVDMLKDAQSLSNREFDKGTSLTNEYNLKNENLAGNLERIGKALRSAFVNSAINEGLTNIIGKIAEWTRTPLSETIEDERIKVNMLTSKLLDANTQLADRKKIVTELKTLAPGVVDGINAESVAYNNLRRNLAEYNKEALNRVIIQRSQEEIDKKNTELVKLAGERLSKEDYLRKQLLQLTEESAYQLGSKVGAQLMGVIQSGEDLIVQAQKVKKIINDNQSGTFGAKVEGVLKMSGVINQILVLEEKESVITGEVNKKFTERDKLMKEFGITISDTTANIAENNNVTETQTENTDDQTKATIELKDSLKDLQELISNFDKQINNAITAGDIPLAQKLTAEKKAAQDLLDVYTELKKQIEKGWDVDQRDMAPIEAIVSKTATNVISGKTGKSPLQSRSNDIQSGPTDQTQDQEQLDQEWKDARIDAALAVNTTLSNIAMNRQQAELDHKLNMLDKQREAELANENLTQQQKDAINSRYDAKARKAKQEAWKKQRNADAISTTIATILAVMKAGGPLNPVGALTALAGALSVVEIMSQKVPEFSKGRYNVTGATTGKQYSNVSYTGPAVTGLYTRPALVAENGGEMIIDSPTTKNLMMNFPGIIDAINNARVPQFAEGRYTSAPSSSAGGSTSTNPLLMAIIKENTEVMRSLRDNGVHSIISLFDLEKKQAQKSNIQSSTEM